MADFDELYCEEYKGLKIYVKKLVNDSADDLNLAENGYVYYEIYNDGVEHLEGSLSEPTNFLIAEVKDAIDIAKNECDHYEKHGCWGWQVSDKDRLSRIIDTVGWINS